MKRAGWTPSIIILVGTLRNNENDKLLCFVASVFFILLVKYYFDNIIIFTEKGYHSGFDRIKLSENIEIVEIERCCMIGKEEFVTFNIYDDEKLIGFDKFFDSDYRYLCKRVSNN
jgi:hypothetical protein